LIFSQVFFFQSKSLKTFKLNKYDSPEETSTTDFKPYVNKKSIKK